MDTNFVNEEYIIYEEDLNMEVTLFYIILLYVNYKINYSNKSIILAR